MATLKESGHERAQAISGRCWQIIPSTGDKGCGRLLDYLSSPVP